MHGKGGPPTMPPGYWVPPPAIGPWSGCWGPCAKGAAGWAGWKGGSPLHAWHGGGGCGGGLLGGTPHSWQCCGGGGCGNGLGMILMMPPAMGGPLGGWGPKGTTGSWAGCKGSPPHGWQCGGGGCGGGGGPPHDWQCCGVGGCGGWLGMMPPAMGPWSGRGPRGAGSWAGWKGSPPHGWQCTVPPPGLDDAAPAQTFAAIWNLDPPSPRRRRGDAAGTRGRRPRALRLGPDTRRRRGVRARVRRLVLGRVRGPCLGPRGSQAESAASPGWLGGAGCRVAFRPAVLQGGGGPCADGIAEGDAERVVMVVSRQQQEKSRQMAAAAASYSKVAQQQGDGQWLRVT